MKTSFFRSKWMLYGVFFVVAGFLVFSFYPAPGGISVQEVEDGDTVILSNGDTVRYIGIDTPEKKQWLWWEATRANEKLVKGKEVRLEPDSEKTDKWGRVLAYVWVDSVMVNEELIKQGLAWVYMNPPNVKHRKRFIALQKEAREKKIGVWLIPISEEDYYVGSKRSPRFHRPDCEWARKIKKENLMGFETRAAALDSGYSPCRICKP